MLLEMQHQEQFEWDGLRWNSWLHVKLKSLGRALTGSWEHRLCRGDALWLKVGEKGNCALRRLTGKFVRGSMEPCILSCVFGYENWST